MKPVCACCEIFTSASCIKLRSMTCAKGVGDLVRLLSVTGDFERAVCVCKLLVCQEEEEMRQMHKQVLSREDDSASAQRLVQMYGWLSEMYLEAGDLT